MYVAFEGEVLKGYILIYTVTAFPSMVLEGESEVAKALIKYAHRDNFILHVPRDLMPIIAEKLSNTKCYVENWMLAKCGHANFFNSPQVRRLSGLEEARKLMMLFAKKKTAQRKV